MRAAGGSTAVQRKRVVLGLLIVLGAAARIPADEKPPVLRASATTDERKLILIELYTSQG